MSNGQPSKESSMKRLIGPVFEPDEVAPSGGIGPVMPPHLAKQFVEKQQSEGFVESADTIGPLVPGLELKDEWRHLKSATLPKPSKEEIEKPKRDLWMTQLMPVSNELAELKPRKFRQGLSHDSIGGPDSSWFAMPSGSQDSNLDATMLMSDKQINPVQARLDEAYNKKMAEFADKCQGDKSQSSLLQLHEEKLLHKKKKKHKKEEKKSKKHKKHKSKKSKKKRSRSSASTSSSSDDQLVRRPFDRDKDMKISRIDPLARRQIIQNSKQFSSRFGHGQQQYL